MTPLIIHDPASCKGELCMRCFDYAQCYAADKEKGIFEVAEMKAHRHPRGCYCSPCVALRGAVKDLIPGRYAALANRLQPNRAAEDDTG